MPNTLHRHIRHLRAECVGLADPASMIGALILLHHHVASSVAVLRLPMVERVVLGRGVMLEAHLVSLRPVSILAIRKLSSPVHR